MKQLSNVRTFTAVTLFVLVFALSALAQGKKENPVEKTITPTKEKTQTAKINVTIHEVVKEDSKAQNVAGGRSIPVRFVWLCGSEGNAKLTELIAELITLNTDGKTTTVTKKLVDWTVNKPINSVIDLPMPNDVFAKSFTLKLVGKFSDGVVEKAVNVVKQGSFPLPNLVGKKR